MHRVDVEQRSTEWFEARLGSLGASSVHGAVVRFKSGGFPASRANIEAQLILERLTGKAQDTYQSKAMLQGIEREPVARAAYEWERQTDVDLVGLVRHPKIDGSHSSPDGLVDSGCVEIKCPEPAAHLDTLLTGKIEPKYITQMQWHMACCEANWCDYVSFNPDFPEPMQLWIKRVERDDERIEQLEQDVAAFLTELAAKLERLQSTYSEAA